ncbi:MAG: hypothetical protein H7210_13175 [Pyrinomonadaceae bacterium]|nr:hypothetical protein [Phycisphaerales bacterium]
MKHPTLIHLGYELGTGNAVEIPLAHMVVTGQTQQAGKTTALEALIQRSGLRAVTFITKRGEQSFTSAPRIDPYFRERADWQYVSAILEATLREKLKFQRPWIMKVTRGTKTLADVQKNVRKELKTAKGLSESVYTELDAYLDIVVPQLAELPTGTSIKFRTGLNVMDLGNYTNEVQALIIRSVLEWVVEKEENTVVVIPEAWEFIPQGKGSPVQYAAEQFARKSAVLKNFLWIDSQDLRGISTIIRGACSVCLLGVQLEPNEVKRSLQYIPTVGVKPKVSDITHLEIGQFVACFSRRAIRTYVQPAWMSEDEARSVATGRIAIEEANSRPPEPTKRPRKQPVVDDSDADTPEIVHPPTPAEPEELDDMAAAQIEQKLDTLISFMIAQAKAQAQVKAQAPGIVPARIGHSEPPAAGGDEEGMYQRFKQRLIQEAPATLAILTEEPELQVTVTKLVLKTDGSTLRGRVGMLIKHGFLSTPKKSAEIRKELERTGASVNGGNLSRELNSLRAAGFLTEEENGWQAVKGMKITKKEE